MGKPILPRDDDDARWRLAVNRRLEALERGRRMPFTVQRGGTWELRSEGGDTRMFFGDFTDPDGSTRYGVSILDGNGYPAFLADEDQPGAVWPMDSTSWVVPTPQTLTSGSFIAVSETQVVGLNGDVFYATGALIVDASTIAQCRVIDVISGQATATIEVNGGGGGVNGNLTLAWEHPFLVGYQNGVGANVFLAWQIRRSAGGGNIVAYPPRGLLIGNQRFLAPSVNGLTFA
jgi:hypothetical protein